MPLAVVYIAAGMLIAAVAPLPYGYYMLLRLVATGVFVWAVYVAYERQYQVMPWVLVLLAVLFNPIIKIHLPREIWAGIDVVAGLVLLTISGKVRERRSGE
jgi:hypothetical protein